jgi:hypothetical protein
MRSESIKYVYIYSLVCPDWEAFYPMERL